jgi:hypothetical protein
MHPDRRRTANPGIGFIGRFNMFWDSGMTYLHDANAKAHREPDLSAIRWNDLFADLFVVCPHAYYLHGPNVIEDLIDKTMLNIDSSRESPRKITHQLFVRRLGLVRIILKYV